MKLLLVAEVAEILRCSESTVYSLLESGKLLGRRCPGWRIKPEDLEAYVEGTKKEPQAPVRRRGPRLQSGRLRL
ncbi:MAG TPA: helix-turn-helix domain-containing protein [Pirellulales bacterium]|nr:helix-turn-helix domain-containing protein [Pirellulales bacterium]